MPKEIKTIDQIRLGVTNIVIQKLNIDPIIVSDNNFKLITDHGADSLKFVKLIVEIENEFELEFDEDTFNTNDFTDLNSIVECVFNMLNARE